MKFRIAALLLGGWSVVAASWAALPPEDPTNESEPALEDAPEPVSPHKETRHDPWQPTPAPPPGYRARQAGPIRQGPFVSVQVNVDSLGNNIPQDAANEPSIAVSPIDPNIIVIGWRQFDSVFSDFRQAGMGYSHDGGQTWTFPGVLEPGVFGSDPVVEVDSVGFFYYLSLQPDRGPGDWACYLYKSFDGGVTWPQETYARGGDKAWMTIDRTGGASDGHLYIQWNRSFSCCNGDFTRSTNGGLTFLDPINVAGNPFWGALNVAPDGKLYVPGSGVELARSSNAANPLVTPTFDLFTTVNLGGGSGIGGGPNPGGLLGQVWIDVDRSNGPTRGFLYLFASVNPAGTDPLDVRFSRSTNQGVTWSPSVRVNDDALDNGAWQWFGTMSVAPNGRIDAVWNDTRADATVTYSQLYYSNSHDAGLHWSANVPLTPRWNHFLGYPIQNKIGDYYDMVSDDDGFYLAYSATFNGEQDVYFLRTVLDCNGNGVPDHLDVAGGTSQDCTGDLHPDECDPDCNSNALSDTCDVAFGTSVDCNANGTPDECEPDCNGNSIADGCDLTAGTSPDCNVNQAPDECELGPGDCNGNSIPDVCDLAAGTSEDCGNNDIPDECEPDCNTNGRADSCDIWLPVGSEDCNLNGIPDECEVAALDCNTNGLPDDCDIATGPQYDCDGNGTPDPCDIAIGAMADADADGIPDPCEGQVCVSPWDGFEPVPPFALGTIIDGLDTDGDGRAWANPTSTGTVSGQGCPSAQGKAYKIVAQTPPTTDFVTSEFFDTVDWRLDCGAPLWSLSFDARSEAQLNPRIDWQLMVRDGKNDRNVMLIHWASTQSVFAGVGTNRGRVLVKNPAGSPTFLTTGFTIPANTCYNLRVTLNNLTGVVELFINGTLRVTTTRLEAGANRLDYFHLQQVANGQASGSVNRMALDNFTLCQDGAQLLWPDCDGNCVSDPVETASGAAEDCNANSVPDVCESTNDCNDNGLRDICETADGLAPDCNTNGVPDFCDVLGHNCCEVGHGTACSNLDVRACVCAVDPYCCQRSWDAICVAEVTSAGCGGCGVDAATADCNFNGVPDECDNCADADGDGDTDATDIAAFAGCLSGPGGATSGSCRCVLDVDADADLDLADYADFQACFEGA